MRALFLNAPQAVLGTTNLPDLDLGSALLGEFDYLHFFTKTQAEMDDVFPKLKRHLKATGMLWPSGPSLNGGPMVKHNEVFSFQIATEDQIETDCYWNAIVANSGPESQCGWCKDKWGVSWQITPRVLI